MARRYLRDARGRFASKGVGGVGGYQGQTGGRGARLKTPGNVRAGGGATMQAARPGSTIGKSAGLKPQDGKKLRLEVALSRQRAINARIGNGPDLAQVNIKGRFRGQAGKRFDAGLDRAVKEVRVSQMAALMKPKAQVRAERAASAEAKRQAAAAKPQRVRSAQSLRMSRAKQVEKRRSTNISNPAGWRQESAGRMAANAARTQERALAFYKKKRK